MLSSRKPGLAADGDATEPITARRQELISEMGQASTAAKLELIGARSFAAS